MTTVAKTGCVGLSLESRTCLMGDYVLFFYLHACRAHVLLPHAREPYPRVRHLFFKNFFGSLRQTARDSLAFTVNLIKSTL